MVPAPSRACSAGPARPGPTPLLLPSMELREAGGTPARGASPGEQKSWGTGLGGAPGNTSCQHGAGLTLGSPFSPEAERLGQCPPWPQGHQVGHGQVAGGLWGWAQRTQLESGSLLENGASLYSTVALQLLQGLSLLLGTRTGVSRRSWCCCSAQHSCRACGQGRECWQE